MAILDTASRGRMYAYFYDCFDEENAGTMDLFVQNFLHNTGVWDVVADHFPTASVSQVKQVMMEAYGAWEKERSGGED